MLFKWNAADKTTGVITVQYGYHGNTKVIGTLSKTKTGIAGTLNFEDGTASTMASKSAKNLKKMLSTHYSNYQSELVTVKALFTGKDVQIQRSQLGGVSDPSTESYHSF